MVNFPIHFNTGKRFKNAPNCSALERVPCWTGILAMSQLNVPPRTNSLDPILAIKTSMSNHHTRSLPKLSFGHSWLGHRWFVPKKNHVNMYYNNTSGQMSKIKHIALVKENEILDEHRSKSSDRNPKKSWPRHHQINLDFFLALVGQLYQPREIVTSQLRSVKEP